MSVSANKQTNLSSEHNVARISTYSRIDYIMRFSKHAVLVLDENSDVYSAVGSHFLGALPSNHNAAFISLSPKLNEIQIRCRLIEQLFVDTLFDPEEALAVTVLKLSTDSKEVISIVVENVQLLSLQLMHEFCQLADLAQKAGRSVNVLLLGEEKTGKLIANNKVVFSDKLSIVSAGNGQLLSIDTIVASTKNALNFLSPFIKGVIAVSILCCAAVILLIFLYKTEIPELSALALLAEQNSKTLKTLELESDNFIKVREVFSPQATGNEIYQQIVTGILNKETSTVIEIAKPNEVAHSLIIEPINTKKLNIKPLIIENSLNVDIFDSTITLDSMGLIENNTADQNELYFQKISQGYVAQIIGFSTLEAYKVFMKKYQQQNFVSYTRILNNTKVFMITTRVYPLKSDVQAVISMLPIELQENKPWIKSIAAINTEIHEYQTIHNQ